MIYLLTFYWLVAGFYTFRLPDPTGYADRHPVITFAASIVVGGIVLPAHVIERLLR